MARRILLDVDFDFFVRESHMLDWGHSESPLFQEIIWAGRVQGALMGGLDLDEVLTSPDDVTPEQFWPALEERGFVFGDDEYDPMCVSGDSHGDVGVSVPRWMAGEEDDEWEIWHFDAHHDLGYGNDPVDEREEKGVLTCADWLYLITRWQPVNIRKIVIVYPEWRRQPDPLSGRGLSMSEADAQQELLAERIAKLAEVGCEVEIVYWNDLPRPEHPVTLISAALSSAWVPPWYDRRFERFVYSSPATEHHYGERWEERGIEVREGWPDSWEEVVEQHGPEARRVGEQMEALRAQK